MPLNYSWLVEIALIHLPFIILYSDLISCSAHLLGFIPRLNLVCHQEEVNSAHDEISDSCHDEHDPPRAYGLLGKGVELVTSLLSLQAMGLAVWLIYDSWRRKRIIIAIIFFENDFVLCFGYLGLICGTFHVRLACSDVLYFKSKRFTNKCRRKYIK